MCLFDTGDVSRFIIKSILIFYALVASVFHIIPVFAEYWIRIGFQTICHVKYHVTFISDAKNRPAQSSNLKLGQDLRKPSFPI